MADGAERDRLVALFERLRERLLDLTKKNRMIAFPIAARSKRQLQIVDEVLEEVYAKLVGGTGEASLVVEPLEDPPGTPEDEKDEEFLAALSHARVTDVAFLTQLAALGETAREDDVAVEKLDRELRDRVRDERGMPKRPSRAEVNRNERARQLGIDPSIDLAPESTKEAHGDKRLQTLKYPDELEGVMEKIASEARLAEQEAGLSTLFLTFGFLEWYETEESEKAYFAPLLLLPARVVRPERRRGRGRRAYAIAAREGEAETNVSLGRFLAVNYGIALPEWDPDETEEPASVEAYLTAVGKAIEGQKRWRVRRQLILGHFAFSRIAIYEDTDPQRWPAHPADHELVGALLTGFDAAPADGATFRAPDDHAIDDPAVESIAPILIHDADSSQHSALIDVMEGKNVVIEGPPGTGKSQTITNAIANLLANGKSVLFLAEKQAALDAVKRRLDTAGLGEFCLELHSDKAAPRVFVKSLADRHAMERQGVVAGQTDPTWATARADIRAYVDALHARQGDGATPFQLMWRSIRGRTQFEDWAAVLAAKLPAAESDPATLPTLRGEVDVFAEAGRRFAERHGHPANSPWQRTPPGDLVGDQRQALLAALEILRERNVAFDAAMVLFGGLGIAAADTAGAVDADGSLGPAPSAVVLAAAVPFDADELSEALALRRTTLAAAAALKLLGPNLFDDAILGRATALNALSRGAHAARRAAEVYAAIERRIAVLDAFVAAVRALTPAVQTLGLPPTTPLDGLEAVAHAAIFAAGVDPRLATWLPAATESVDTRRLLGKRRELLREEGELRRQLPRAPAGDWPDSATLDQAVGETQRGGLSKLFGGKTLRDIRARLGLSDSPSDLVLLKRVADHRRRLDEFLADPAGRASFGDEWRGLGSPFEPFEQALAARDNIERLVQPLPEGHGVLAALWRLAPDSLPRLGALAGAAAAFRERLPIFAPLVNATPLDRAPAACSRERTTLDGILAQDPGRTLAAIDVPIGRLAEIDAARGAARLATDAARAHPHAAAAEAIAPDVAALEAATQAVKFLALARSLDLPAELRSRLLSAPMETRRALHDAVVAWVEAEAGQQEALAEVAAAGLPLAEHVAPSELGTHVEALLAGAPALSDFVALRRMRLGLDGFGLGSFLAAADDARVPPDLIPGLLDAALARRRAEAARRNAEPLARRTGIDLEARRKTFIDRDRAKKEADRSTVRGRLLERNAPVGVRGGSVKTWTEMSLLDREFKKQQQFPPVRDLLRRAGGAVRAMKPCFMMSPLSLAKFLPAGSFAFDVLVIDEASQMRPEDALGAMLRAKQIVVVGDPKQLPPTSFFERSAEVAGDEDEAHDDVDDESILERCEKVFGQLRRLKWHYRSRCESLIRFSNEQFYDSTLVTFPAARPNSFSVDLVRAGGSFAARRNVVEAERVVEEAIAFMRHFAEAENPPSLGIVALNIDQRDVIEETLWRISMNDPLVESYQEKTAKRGEGVFVKNLENVQGDERDFIFISMTYGMAPDATAMAQRFGPINSVNGHRRLNVLFSRARLRMVLFASFGSSDIRPGPSSHRGVRVLKEYLQYAETRGSAAAVATGREPDSDFETEVSARLRKRGYETELQVGVSGFRIDIGIRHPDRPDTFLAGIECDGARYHASRSARDRDRLREEVLRGLGWTILRVWSTDWFDDPDTQADRLVAKLDELRSTPTHESLAYRFAGGAVPAVAPRATEPLPPATAAIEPTAAAVGQAGLAAVAATSTLEPEAAQTAGGDTPMPGGGAAESAGSLDGMAGATPNAGGVPVAGADDPAPAGETDELLALPTLPLFADVPDSGDGSGTGARDAPPGDPVAKPLTAPAAAPVEAATTAETIAPRGSTGERPLTETELEAALVAFRETTIRANAGSYEPHRSILRPGMIETLIRQRIADPEDWFTRVPLYQRSGTDPTEKRLYLEAICAIVARLE